MNQKVVDGSIPRDFRSSEKRIRSCSECCFPDLGLRNAFAFRYGYRFKSKRMA